MPDPKDCIGKIVKTLEKYYDAQTGRIRVKSRPSLIIGYEPDYSSAIDVDYELLPIATLKNRTPNPTYDLAIDGEMVAKLGLKESCFIRTHKIAWNHVKNMIIDPPIGDLKCIDGELFKKILLLNEQWVNKRTKDGTT